MEEDPKLARRDRHGVWRWSFFHLRSLRRVTAEEAVAELRSRRGRVISSSEDDDGVVRLRVVISKQELKQMLASMRHKRGGSAAAPPAPGPPAAAQSLEMSLRALQRRHMRRTQSMRGGSGWIPALQSIPEEN